MSDLVNFLTSKRYVGVRLRSIRKHCRLGRATELVIILSTGVSIVLGGTSVQAQQAWQDGNADDTWNTTSTNWDAGVIFTKGNDAVFGGTGETVTIDEPGGIEVDDVTFDVDGYSIIGNDLEVTGTISVTNAADSATIEANISSDVVIGGDGTVALAGDTTGTLTTAGGADIDGDITGNLISSGTTTLAGDVSGTVAQSAGSVTVDGASTLTGAVTISGGSFTASAQTTLGAGLSNDGTLDINAAVLGGQTLTNTKAATIGANITGSFVQNTDAAATTTVDGVANVSGGLDIDTGTLTVSAALTGDVDVAAGASYDQNNGLTGTLTTAGGADIDGDITGNLISSGTTTLAGNVSGTVAQSAGSVTVDGASTLTGAVTISGGSFTASAQTTLGAGLSNDGTLDINAAVLGGQTLTNTKAATIGANITGSFVQNTDAAATTTVDGVANVSGGLDIDTGTLTVSAALTGDVDVAAGASYDQNNGLTGTLTTAGGADIDGDITGNLISSGTTTLAGNVSGTVAQSAGSVTVDGASTLTGAVTISGGSFTASAQTTLGAGLSNDGTLDINAAVLGGQTLTNTKAATIGANITGSFVQNTDAAATTTVDGVANVSGGLDIDTGTLTVSAALTGDVDVAAGASYDQNNGLTGTLTTAGGADIDGDITGNLISSGTTTLAGNVSGTVAQSAGSVTVDGASTLTGAVTISGGSFTASAQTTLGAGLSNDGTLDINAAVLGGQTLTNTKAATIGANITGSFVQNTDAAATTTVDGVANVSGGLDIDTGTLTVSAALTGDVDVAAGASYDQNNGLTGTLTTAGGADIDGDITGNLISSGTTTLAGNVSGTVAQSAGSVTVDGASTLTGAVTISGGSFTASAQTTLGAGLSNDGTLDINAAVLGGQTLTNTKAATIGANITGSFVQNTDAAATTTVDGVANVSGGLDIDTGTLTVSAALTGDVDVAAGASYDQNNGLTGTLTTAGGADIDGDITGNLISSGTTTLAGNVSGTVAQSAGSVTVDGASTLTGAVTISGGSFTASAQTTLGAGLSNDGTLDINAAVLGGQTLTNTKAATIGANITGSFVQNTDAAATTTVDGVANVSGGLDIDTGTLTVSAALTGDVDVAAGASYDQNNGLTGNLTTAGGADIDGDITGNLISSGTTTLAGNVSGTVAQSAGSVTVDGASTLTGAVTISGGSFTASAQTTLGAGLSNDGTLDINAAVLGGQTLTNTKAATIGANITGSFVQNTDAAATTTVDGVANVSGGLDIDTGTLTVSAALTGDVDVAAGASYDQNNGLTGNLTTAGGADIDGDITGNLISSGTTTLAGNVSGTVAQSAGSVTVDGASTLTGAVTISGGSFTASAQTTLGAGLSNDGTLDINAAVLGGQTLTNTKAATIGANITGSFVQNTDAAATTTVDGVANVSGGLDIDTGTLTVSAALTGDVDVAAGASYDQNNGLTGTLTTAGGADIDGDITGNLISSGTTTLAGNVSGTVAQSAGSVTVDGASTLTGAVTISGGSFTASAQTTLGAGLSNDGTLDINAAVLGGQTLTNTKAATIGANITGSFVQNTDAAATTTVDGVANVSGGLDIDTGTLTVSAALTGDVDVAAGASYDQNNGLTGNLTTAGGADIDGDITGNLISSGTTTLAGNVSGTVAQSAGSVTVDGASTLTGAVTISGGSFTASAQTTLGAGLSNDGTLDINAAVLGGQTLTNTKAATIGANITGSFVQNTDAAATTTVDGVANVSGGLDIDTGTLTVSAALTGDVDVAAGASYDQNNGLTGTLTTAGGADIDGDITGNLISSGTTTLAGNVSGTVAQSAGSVTVDGASTLTGAVTISGGSFTASAQTTLGAGLSNDGTLDINAAVLGGQTLTNTKAATIGANITGSFVQNTDAAATTTVDGVANVSGGLDIDTGTLTVSAALTGDVDVAAGASYDQNNGLTGTLTTAGGADIDGDITGNLISSGTTTLAGNVSGTVAQSAGSVTVDGASTITGAVTIGDGAGAAGSAELEVAVGETLTSAGGVTVAASDGLLDVDGTVAGAVTVTAGEVDLSGNVIGSVTLNGGNLGLNGGTISNGLINNGGTLTTNGTVTIGGDFVSSVTLDMIDDDTTSVVNINGNADFTNGTIRFDINPTSTDLVGGNAKTADFIDVNGALAGDNISLFFNNIDVNNKQELDVSIPLIEYDTLALNPLTDIANIDGLRTNGSFVYQIEDLPIAPNGGAGALYLEAVANPSIGAVNGAIAATQSLISSVVNRPSAALITSLVNPEDDPCVLGNWGRVTGGRAEATLVSSSGGLQATNNIEMTYRGFQVGLDRSCTYGGDATDLAYGAIMGMNTGSSSLPVFAYDVISQDFDSDQAAVTFVENEFQQTFGGAYLSAAQGDLSGDVLVRMDRTEYDISETSDFANEGLGLEDQTYESRGTTLSGSVSYTTTVDETRGILFTPTVGFSFSRIENDNIAIVGDPADPTDDSTLVIDDIEQQIGLIGGTLRRTQVLPGNNSALTYFTTATYFKDFSGNQNATLELNGTEADIVSENLGGFGELSIGVNYTDLLGEGSRIPARQLDTSIRLDSRFSNKLDSWGITAQLRLQF